MLTSEFGGMKVYERPDPRRYYSLPADVQVPATFRAEFDAWAKRFFPPDPALNMIKDGEFLVVLDREVHMNPRTMAQFRRAMKEQK